MANEEHLKILKQGVEVWNTWRAENPDDINPDLSKANLFQANLIRANLIKADLWGAILIEANLSKANLFQANLIGVNLIEANLSGAYLFGANLSEADLTGAKLIGANLSGAKLTRATLVETNLTGTDLTGCSIYGISAWELKLEGATQTDLIITRHGEPTITVDNLEVAQFIYLLLNNEKIRDVIDSITTKVVLILGRFTPERKAILDAIRDELRCSTSINPPVETLRKPFAPWRTWPGSSSPTSRSREAFPKSCRPSSRALRCRFSHCCWKVQQANGACSRT